MVDASCAFAGRLRGKIKCFEIAWLHVIGFKMGPGIVLTLIQNPRLSLIMLKNVLCMFMSTNEVCWT